MAEIPESDADEKDDGEREEKILALAKARFKLAAEAESDQRKEALDDLKFSVGEQWPDSVRKEREMDSRPCLTINRLNTTIRQVTNEGRQNRPAIKISPIDSNATVETAEIIQGLVRHIEVNSNADYAYDTSSDGQVRGGLGWFRVLTGYSDPESFDQELLIKRIRNALTVYRDPSSREPDGSDMQWCIIVEDYTPEEYREAYPDSEMAGLSDFSSIGDAAADWLPGGSVRVAEYYYIEYAERELALLSNNKVVKTDTLPKKADGSHDLPEGIKVMKTRMARIPSVRWCKHNAVEIIEEKETVFSQWIPVIPVYGEEIEIDGKVRIAGIVRDAKDAQRMSNYWASAETEAIALAPKSPYVIAEGQLENHEGEWATANTRNHPYLSYKPTTIAGQPVGAPERQTAEPAVMAITNARAASNDDIKYTTGVFDASLGQRSNEQSGVAITRRNNQAQTSNFHFSDNFHRSLRHCGRILVDAIPRVYDAARTVRIIGADNEQKQVLINQETVSDGKKIIYDMAAGRYDVAVDTGPSYATKRQEAVASMIELTGKIPALQTAAPDLVVRAMDWEGASDIADRLKKGLPPQFQDQDPNKQPIPAQAQAQIQQMGQQLQAMTKLLHDLSAKLENKAMELASKERINLQNNQTKAEIALAMVGSERDREMLRAETNRIEADLDRTHEASLQDFQTISQGAGSAGAAAPNAPTGGQAPGSPMGNQT